MRPARENRCSATTFGGVLFTCQTYDNPYHEKSPYDKDEQFH
jgi:hypothetical protein